MFPALLILALGPDTVRIMSLSSWISSIPGLQKTSCCEYVCVCVVFVCSPALIFGIVAQAWACQSLVLWSPVLSSWPPPDDPEIAKSKHLTLDELRMDIGMNSIQVPLAFLSDFLPSSSTRRLSFSSSTATCRCKTPDVWKPYILLSTDQTKSAENQASLYLVSIRCVPPEKLEPGLQHFKILHYLQQGLESLTNESRCDYQMQYMKENHLKKKIGWPDPPPCHWCHHISGWKSTLSSQPGVITWQFVACFEKKLSLPWLFWHNLGRSSACPRCTHPPRIPGFCITTTSVQVRTSLQKHVSLKLQPQIWKKI